MTDERPDPEALLAALNANEREKERGELKIFFGYAAGVGKTYAMLEEARKLLESGIDIIVGYIEPHQRPQTMALLTGLPRIPPLQVTYKDITLAEFDLDSALQRRPAIILVDELAHTNAPTCRHAKRYQDVEELLRAGIDVYTTLNAQHLEGLQDVVEAVTGVAVRERIPDAFFDGADKVELADLEPQDLLARLGAGKIYSAEQAERACGNFFTLENLVALREIALRRAADRVNMAAEKSRTPHSAYVTDEHILMCLSSSPSNARVIRTAARMAEAFHGSFTALFVETPDYALMSIENRTRLRKNTRLAEQLGAKIATIYGDDVPLQVAEYAKTSGISKIVLGRPGTRRLFGLGRRNYVDRLADYAPDLEVFVIPDRAARPIGKPGKRAGKMRPPVIIAADVFKTLACLAGATVVGFLFRHLGFSEANIITVYILASLFIAVITERKLYSLAASFFAVLLFNFFFTKPYFSLDAYDSGYPVTFIIMFFSAFITSTLTKRVKEQAKQAALKAHHTEILLETSQKLQTAKDTFAILIETARQIQKLLGKQVLIYPVEGKALSRARIPDEVGEDLKACASEEEYGVAQWVYVNNKHAGATTDTFSHAKCLYMSVRSGDTVFAVLGIVMNDGKLGSFEKNLLVAMLAECALAFEKEAIRESKNALALKADRERLRANLLRAISHDLRTPLTGIAGGSGFMLEKLDTLDPQTVRSILADIESDALWLSNLVENLLNLTRIEDGKLTIDKKNELVDEVLEAALPKVVKRRGARTIRIEKPDEPVWVRMDSQLIIQVIINLLDNAFKHTTDGSEIILRYERDEANCTISVSDNGGGIPPDRLERIFEPFYTSMQSGSDRQRGMGLGLNICKSIVEAHGGTISARNNECGGATFVVSLPRE